jgi:hypothetical protein
MIIVGGGGLFFFDSLEYLLTNCSKPVIGWGIGCNEHGIKKIQYPKYVNLFTFLGTRDWNSGFDWVPCPSCMHSIFDQDLEILHDIVVYEHRDNPLNFDFPKANNSLEFSEAIKHIASGATILTNTYHGMYWGTLLGRKVIAFPFSNRFYGMKYPVYISENGVWKESYGKAFPEALKECRKANLDFYQKIYNFMNELSS